MFKDVNPMTPEQWADGFRYDTHPDKEIEWWTNLGGAFKYFTEGKGMSLEHRKDYYELCVSYFNNGPAALQTVTLRRLSKARAKGVIEILKKGRKE